MSRSLGSYDKIHNGTLKYFKSILLEAILKHEKINAPAIIIDEMKKALNHVEKAIDILEWDIE